MAQPFHSIVIPTAGRKYPIDACLDSVVQNIRSQPELECLLIDNNSSGDYSEYVSSLCKTKYPQDIIYIHESSPGLSAARHAGARNAKGEIISFLDDDVLLSGTWLAAVRNAFADAEVHLVGGPTLPLLHEPFPDWIAQMVTTTPWGGAMLTWLSLLDIGKDVSNIHPNYIFGLNFSIRKNTLIEVGGFHPDVVPAFKMWQGDGETGLTMKMFKAGKRADYIQDVKLFHFCLPERLTIEYFLKRAYYQGVADSFSALRVGFTERSLNEQLLSLKSSLARILSESRPDHNVANKYITLASLTAKIDHVSAVEKNRKLQEWIRKDDYLNSCIKDFSEHP